MKLIPYLRFFWATITLYSYVRQVNGRNDVGLIFILLGGLLTLTFVSYCIIIGLREINNRPRIDAKYFETFGVIFELLIFIGGFYLLTILLRQQLDPSRIGLVILWQLGLLTLLIADVKRIGAS